MNEFENIKCNNVLIGRKLSIDIGLSSAKKGLVLSGAGAVLISDHQELIATSVSADGVQFGGIIGLWETLRNEFK